MHFARWNEGKKQTSDIAGLIFDIVHGNLIQGSAKRRGLGCVNSLPGSANSHAFLPISVQDDVNVKV